METKEETPVRFARRARRIVERLVDVRHNELPAMILAAAYMFLLLCGYSMIRPIRDVISTTNDSRNLSLLWTIVSITMVVLSPAYMAIVGRSSRGRFIPWVYQFFAANLVIFFILMRALPSEGLVWLDRVFYVWVSVYNLFVVSVFWSFMADVFSTDQAKRLFGFISVGGTLGAASGAGITSVLVDPPNSIFGIDTSFLDTVQLRSSTILLISAALLLCTCLCVRALNRLDAHHPARAHEATIPVANAREARSQAAIGGTVIEGLAAIFRSPYLLGICAYLFLYSLSSSFLYFAQADIVRDAFASRAARIAFFARVDLLVQLLTIFIQCFLTGRIMRIFGVGLTLCILPFISLAGFTSLGMMPTLAALVIFQVGRRAGNYALSRPAREVLFTVVPRADKYKAKNFIDTAVYRWSDTINAWLFAGLQSFGLALTGIAFTAVPLAAIWLTIGGWLGRQLVRRSDVHEAGPMLAG